LQKWIVFFDQRDEQPIPLRPIEALDLTRHVGKPPGRCSGWPTRRYLEKITIDPQEFGKSGLRSGMPVEPLRRRRLHLVVVNLFNPHAQ